MASPISAGEIYAVAKFAYELLQSCQKARGEFNQIANEVSAMRTVLQLAHLECKNPVSILNVTDTKDKSNRRALTIHLGRCHQALEDVEACLKRYKKMSAMDKFAWSLRGRDEVKELESNLSSFATQLDSFFGQLTVKGVGAVYEGIGRIEEALDRLGGNEGAAVGESTSFTTIAPDPRSPESRGRSQSNSTLSVPVIQNQNRSKSVENIKGAKISDVKQKAAPSTKPLARNKPQRRLECWLIQIKSGHLSLVDWEYSEKMLQIRGQWKLEEIARQFRASKKSKLKNDDKLVNWVLNDRRKKEDNPNFTWYPYAAKKEEMGALMLNLGVQEQAMVIIKRALTNEARKKQDQREKAVKAKKDTVRKKAAKQAADQRNRSIAAQKLKSEKQRQIKSFEDITKKEALIEKLQKENAKLKAQGSKTEKQLKVKEDSTKRKEPVKRWDNEKSELRTEMKKGKGGLKTNSSNVKDTQKASQDTGGRETP